MGKRILITLAFVLLLTGCGAAGWGNVKEEGTANTETTIMYTATKEIIDPSEKGKFWYGAQAIGDSLYYVAREQQVRGSNWELYVKNPAQEASRIAELAGLIGDEFAMDEERNTYYISNEAGKFWLCKVNEKGEVLFKKEVPSAEEYLKKTGAKLTTAVAAIASEEGFCLLGKNGTCVMWTPQGDLIGYAKVDWYEDGMETALGDYGLVKGANDSYVYHRKERSVFLQALNFETGTLGDAVEVKMPELKKDYSKWMSANCLYSAYEEGIYIIDHEALFLYNDAAGELKELLRWDEPGVNVTRNDIKAIGKDTDGNLKFYEYNYGIKEGAQICIKEEETTKLLLTLGHLEGEFSYAAKEKAYVTEFNRMQEEVVIVCKEYADVIALQADLEAGTGPDILDLTGIDIEEYVEKGILEGLDSYLEESERLDAEDILPSLLREMTFEDEVRFLSPGFGIWTMILAEEDAVQDGLTTEEFLSLVSEGDGYLCDWVRSSVFQKLLYLNLDQYVDWQNRSCSFDDGRFADFLEAVKAAKLPEKKDSGTGNLLRDMKTGKFQAAFRGFNTLQSFRQMREAMEEVALIAGMPEEEGTLKYDLYFDYGLLAINSASQKKDAAWEYLEYHMLKYAENCQQYSDAFSTLTEKFEEQLYPQQAENIAYITQNVFTGKSERVIFTSKEEDREAIRSILENVELNGSGAGSDGVIGAIIDEEAESFFGGGKSAEETAVTIQERVAAYMKE